ncbi:hypothetical protein Pmar_PMAR020094 [Perkinsus marinus ATCC 50983]|uniref:Uncharacterized protein n=1 Tax=Perkinsus marinus (strain ATCC 50983 / TXsc) TaxID=423536 RepID=C5KWP0_PERM5|nr:hypothetical protein Pmar_PMAR020094 [Perkinsus marinus ATCC 50983]EER11115.1 hypothetical protein Pmar_PMAR020094 [Perkinsus marinus ATCC 50983]|eukprot:XP_002779320.1 hypothetical protein Pmar_PMAR020094 [Perkinsus marinus ATCC 50983]
MRCCGGSGTRDRALVDILDHDSTTVLSATYEAQGGGLRLPPPAETHTKVLVYGAPFVGLIDVGNAEEGQEGAVGSREKNYHRKRSFSFNADQPRVVSSKSTGKRDGALVSAPIVLEGGVLANPELDSFLTRYTR